MSAIICINRACCGYLAKHYIQQLFTLYSRKKMDFNRGINECKIGFGKKVLKRSDVRLYEPRDYQVKLNKHHIHDKILNGCFLFSHS